MKSFKYMAAVVFAAMAISSCEEDTQSIGNSLTNDSDKLDMSTFTFKATTQTIVADSVLINSTGCFMGQIKDPETQAIIKSEFTTQFNILEDLYISPAQYFVNKDGQGKAVADSCDFVIFIKSPFSTASNLSAMQMRVRELQSPVDPSNYIYSNYDAEPLVRKDANAININHVFTYTNMTDGDGSRSASSYLNNIRIPLNQPYTRDGVTYSNYGTYLLQQYHEHKENFANSYVFAQKVCPGFSFEITDGLGFYTSVSHIGLRFYYKLNRDSVFNASVTLAGTKEVLQTVKITNDKARLVQLANEANNSNYSYLKSPAGLFTEVTLPIDEIWNGHESDSLLAAKVSFQRLNNDTVDARALGIPQTLLMVTKDSLYTFFEKKNLPNNKTSYYTSYNSTYNIYTYTNISNLITQLRKRKVQGLASDPNWVASHPDWNKVVLVPISYTTNPSTKAITRVTNDLSLNSTRLLGGKSYPIEISIVYAKFKK